MDSVQIEKMVTVTYHMMTHLTDGTIKDHPEEGVMWAIEKT
jgi:hypothetical protein